MLEIYLYILTVTDKQSQLKKTLSIVITKQSHITLFYLQPDEVCMCSDITTRDKLLECAKGDTTNKTNL